MALLDDVVARLEQDRTLRFHLDGQAILADDYLEVRPDQRARLQRLVGAGRLSVGPWYVLADELLAGDEPLVRNLLIGRNRAAAFGGWLAVGYSPDAFGHPDALPTILRGFGIDTAVLWRGYGSGGRKDRDLFRWQGPDGSEVLVHHLPPAGYEYGAELPTDPAAATERWRALGAVLEPRAATSVALLLNGADHHALQPNLRAAVRQVRRASRAVVEVGTLDEYFAAVRQALGPDAPPLTVVAGELRASCGHTWVLPGVAATRTTLKQHIAEGAALLVRWAEPQVALAGAGAHRRALVEHTWRTHLANLSHDVLAGCVSDRVADDAETRARHVIEEARGLLVDALDVRLRQDPVRRRREQARRCPSLVLVNPSPSARHGTVEATVTVEQHSIVVGRPAPAPRTTALEAFRLVDPAGRAVPLQVLGVGEAYERWDSPRDYPESSRVWTVRVALYARDVPAFGLARLDLRRRAGADAAPPDPVVTARGRLRASWGGVQVTARGFAVHAAERLLTLAPLLTSERDEGDTYTIEPVEGDVPLAPRWGRPRVVWAGPLAAALARPFQIGRRVRGAVFVRVDAGSPLIRVTVEGVNRGRNHRLRLHVPVGPVREATADMAFGAVTRPRGDRERPPFPREHPATTGPMHRYVSAGGWTVFARGLHEYELLPDGSLSVTLLRAVGDLSRGALRARPGHAGWPTTTPGAQGLGAFRAELAIAPAELGPRATAAAWDDVERLAEVFHAPLAGYMCRAGIDVPPVVRGPRLAGAGLAFKALKPRDVGAGVVLRCVNLTRRTRRGRWMWPEPISRAYRARLDETVEAELPLSPNRQTVAFTAKPREVVTIVVEP